jgi:iron complex transport system ATP-binding protein
VGRLGALDTKAVDEALAACDLAPFAQRATDQLSGGEQARVHFARALAAQTPLLIADEPVAALDPYHQLRVMNLIRDYVQAGGGALVVLHDIALAARFADRLLWMRQGEIKASGTVAETLTEDRLAEIYRVTARVRGTEIDILDAL